MLEVIITQTIPEDGWTRNEQLTGIFDDWTDVGMMMKALSSRFKIDEIKVRELRTEELPDTEEVG